MSVTWHVTCRVGPEDTFCAQGQAGDKYFSFDISDMRGMLRTNTWQQLDTHGLEPPPTAIDLYRAAAVVFSCDLRIPRKTAYDKWARDIKLYLPVSNLALWQNASDPFTKLLRFLSGDHWQIEWREQKVPRPAIDTKQRKEAVPLETKTACLLSGGLDSFIGAADALAEGTKPMLVSLYGGGLGTHASPVQKTVIKAFERRYSKECMRHLHFHFNPSKELTGISESTMRTRSLIFFGLGTLVASALGEEGTCLLIPENGFVSLNVPLTYSRLGSLSTRTTHPYTLYLFRQVLGRLGLETSLKDPYRFKTKAEMLLKANDYEFISSTAHKTMSCAHPNAGRFKGRGPQHCGYCVPCIVRRAAMVKAGINDQKYTVDVRVDEISEQKGKDLRAFKIAAERAKDGVSAANVLKAGPLKCDPVEVPHYIDVYRRGLKEVADFLEN